MTAITDLRRTWISGWVIAVFVMLTGCQNIYDVKVDAINNPQKPTGNSYVLEVQDPSGGVDKELGVQTVVSVKSALAARGLYEAPVNTRPDMVINLEYGVGPGQIKFVYRTGEYAVWTSGAPQGPSAKPILVFEKYIVLSAREAGAPKAPPARGGGRKRESRGEELWSLRVSVEDPKKDLKPYLAVLASGSIDYIGRNSGSEVSLRMDANGNLQGRQAPPPSR